MNVIYPETTKIVHRITGKNQEIYSIVKENGPSVKTSRLSLKQ